jgi:pilus assembly protein FimV
VPLPIAAAPKPQPLPAARPAAALQAGEEYVEAPVAARKPAPHTLPVARKLPPKKPAKSVPAPDKAHAAHAEPPSCPPQAASEQLNACVALGEKNAALRHDLGKLEDKVKVLQGAAKPVPAATIEAPAAAPAAAVEHAPAPPAAPAAHLVEPAHAAKEVLKQAPADAPKGAPRIHRKPKKVETPEPESGFPWLALGAGVAGLLAVAGLVLALLRRRKRAAIGKIQEAHKPSRIPKPEEAGESKPAFMAAVKARLMPGRGKAAASEAPATPAEPVPAEVVSRPE